MQYTEMRYTETYLSLCMEMEIKLNGFWYLFYSILDPLTDGKI